MPSPVTRFTYAMWSQEAGIRTSVRSHACLVFSRTDPWHYEDLIEIVKYQENISSFLRFPDHPYFILHSPPPKETSWEKHPLTRKPYRNSYRMPLSQDLRTRYAPEGDDLIRKDLEEYRYLAVPTVTSVLSRELHPSTLDYKFTLVWESGHQTFSYREMWELCPIIQGMYDGSYGCVRCDLRGKKCINNWFEKLLKQKNVPLSLENLQYHDGSHFILHDADPTYFYIPPNWNEKYREKFQGVDNVLLEMAAFPGQLPLPGMEVKHKTTRLKFVSRGKCKRPGSSPFTPKHEYTPAQTYLDPDTIEHFDLYYKKLSKKASKSRKQRNSICGTRSNPCVLKCEGCTRWRSYRNDPPCKTKWDSVAQMYREGIAKFKLETTYTNADFQRAFYFAGLEFKCINPETRRECFVDYGGLRFRNGKAVHVIVRHQRSELTEWFAGSWEELRCFIRRWSPWNAKRFASQDWADIEISDEVKLLYAECASKDVYWVSTPGGGWGGSYIHEVVSVEPCWKRSIYEEANTSICVKTTSFVMDELVFSSPIELITYRGWYGWFTWIPE